MARFTGAAADGLEVRVPGTVPVQPLQHSAGGRRDPGHPQPAHAEEVVSCAGDVLSLSVTAGPADVVCSGRCWSERGGGADNPSRRSLESVRRSGPDWSRRPPSSEPQRPPAAAR